MDGFTIGLMIKKSSSVSILVNLGTPRISVGPPWTSPGTFSEEVLVVADEVVILEVVNIMHIL